LTTNVYGSAPDGAPSFGARSTVRKPTATPSPGTSYSRCAPMPFGHHSSGESTSSSTSPSASTIPTPSASRALGCTSGGGSRVTGRQMPWWIIRGQKSQP
jgi:hypothetical protein